MILEDVEWKRVTIWSDFLEMSGQVKVDNGTITYDYWGPDPDGNVEQILSEFANGERKPWEPREVYLDEYHPKMMAWHIANRLEDLDEVSGVNVPKNDYTERNF
jgi:hypothetical protein